MQHSRSLALALVLAMSTVLAGLPAGASAQQPAGQEDLERRLDELFRKTLERPTDLNLLFEYARVATEVGDLEAAIVAYERLLIINPDLPRVRFELGVLYHQLKSFDAARIYLQRAQQSSDLPPAVREQASALLAQIDAATRQVSFSGSISAGLRYQSNATAVPSSSVVRAQGADVVLPGGTAASDWNLFANAAFRHLYDLEDQRFSMIESNGLVYGTRQLDENQLNLLLVDLRSGWRFRPLADDPDTTLRPHLLLSAVGLDDEMFSHRYGLGLDLSHRFTTGLVVEATVDTGPRRYYDIASQPNGGDRTGLETGIALRAQYPLSPARFVLVEAGYRDADARTGAQQFDEFSVGASYTARYDSPLGFLPEDWTTSVSVHRIWTDYDAPDPTVDPNIARADREWRLGVTQILPFDARWSMLMQLQANWVDSSLANFEYRNFSGMLGITRSF